MVSKQTIHLFILDEDQQMKANEFDKYVVSTVLK